MKEYLVVNVPELQTLVSNCEQATIRGLGAARWHLYSYYS